MKLSLVIPTFKKENEVTNQISTLYSFLTAQKIQFELIVVIDGIVDNTEKIVESFIKQEKYRRVKVLSYRINRGKGYAIRYGMRKATGDVIGFIDADTDIKIKSLKVALNRVKKGDVDVVVPSKYIKGAEADVNIKRRILSLGLLFLSRTLIGQPSNLKDVSCGLKLFKKEVVSKILPLLTVDRFAIDSEIFYWVNKLGFKVAVVPFFMKIGQSSTSTKPLQILLMIKDILVLGARDMKRNIVVTKNAFITRLKLSIDTFRDL